MTDIHVPVDASHAPVPTLPPAILSDVLTVSRIDCVPSILRIICEATGMRFAAVARVTDDSWTACAVHDEIAFGLKAGGQLDVHTTLCKEVRAAHEPILIDHASRNATYCTHHTPRIYGIESYVSVPVVLSSGEYFGNLCAIDPLPAKVSDPRTLAMFERFAELIGLQLDTEREREQERAVLLNERQSSELREQFIAVLGHDLRNPLSAIAACAGVLQRHVDATVSGLGARIAANSRRMAGLIADTMDLARGRLGGGLGVELARTDALGEALEAVVDELRDAHPDRQVVCRTVVPQTTWCDAPRIQQLASNLLANALAHGSADEPVRVSAWVEDDALVLEVHNAGEPIDPGSLQRIFEPYWRRASPHRGEGLGLGLYICAQIVAAHGGHLDVRSTAEAGTRFVARLPILTAPAHDGASSQP